MIKLLVASALISAAVIIVYGDVCPDGSRCAGARSCCQSTVDGKLTGFACCPYENGTCCKNKSTCCPEGRTCFLKYCLPLGQKSDNSGKKFSEALLKQKQVLKPLTALEEIRDQPCGPTSCTDDSTCCYDVGCCPYENAVCCSDKEHCCPQGTRCDIKQQLCLTSKYSKLVEKGVSLQTTKPQNASCPHEYTQCNSFSCCPLSKAECCSDGIHCCPQGTTCDLNEKICQKEKNPTKSWKTVNDKYVICPDGAYCGNNNTCCLLINGRYGCCPYPLATCCADRIHCCPQYSTCDSTFQYCIRGNNTTGSKQKLPSITFN